MMNKVLFATARGLRSALVAVVALAGAGAVLAIGANYTMTQGVGTTFASAVISAANYVEFLLCDATAGSTQCAAVKAASTAAVATDPAVVVAISPNNTVKVGIDQTTPGTTNAVSANQGTAAAVANSWYAKLSDGTNGPVAVKAASTAPTATDLALVVSLSPNSAGIVSPSSTTGNIAANNTTAVVLKASAGVLYGVQLAGLGSAPAYLKIYNAASATCGSGTPVKRLMIPAASTAANGAGSNITFGPQGVNFGTGITYCVTTGILDTDTNAPAASTFLVNVDWS